MAAGVLSAAHGWRIALMGVGLPGLLIAFLVLTMLREPARKRFKTAREKAPPPVPIRQALAFAAAQPA